MQEALLAIPLGIIVGLSLGALGAGGSILTVPALVLLLGRTPHEAAATSLIVVGSAAAAGALTHARRGAVRFRAGSWFAAAGIIGSLVGSVLSLQVDEDALALAFAAVMLAAAWSMWPRGRRVAEPGDEGAGRHLQVRRTVLAGSLVGAMTGFFGIGGGFLAVPALIYALRLPMATAVGTSLLVIALNSAVALVPRIAGGLVDPVLTTMFVLGGIGGSVLGTRLAHDVSPGTLRRVFALTVVATAGVLAIRTLLG